MSHNIVLSGVRITDLDLLAQAVDTVSQGRAKLHIGQKTFRTYRGQSPVCLHAIVFEGGSYDVGVIAAPADDSGEESFTFVADFTMLDATVLADQAAVRDAMLHYRQLCVPEEQREETEHPGPFIAGRDLLDRIKIGAMLREYTLLAHEQTAAMNGYVTNRISHPNGTVSLEVERIGG